MTDKEYYIWDYLEFKTETELQKYIDEIKDLLVGESINHIFVSPDYQQEGSRIQGYDILKENENVAIDLIAAPVILKIGQHTLYVDMYGGSDIKISVDSKFEITKPEEMIYSEISSLFSKNIIGYTISDITVTPISRWGAEASVNWFPKDAFSDDMFEQLVIELENGYKFVFCIDGDNTGIYEGI